MPIWPTIVIMASRRPTSPTRFMMKAFLAAAAFSRLVACSPWGASASAGVPEADEQVGGQAHGLPADEEHDVGVTQDQGEHRGDEEVEVGEEAAPVAVVGHVGHRVQVDEEADAGDQGDEGQRERVQTQADVDAQVPAENQW